MTRRSCCVSVRSSVRTGGLELESRLVPTLNVSPIIAIGSGPGMDATVRVLDVNGNELSSFKPFPLGDGSYFGGGVETAVGDINGDTVPDVIAGAGYGGGPHVVVFNGVDILAGSSNPGILRSFFAFEDTFRGGVNVAAGDIDGDGSIDVICGAGPSAGAHLVAYSNGNRALQILNVFPFEPSFRGGVRVGAGDFGGDGNSDEIVVGAGEGGGPRVIIFDWVPASSPTLAFTKLADFFAFDPSLRGGVHVAAGYTTNNRDAQGFLYADVIAGTGGGTNAEVRVFRLLDAFDNQFGNPDWDYELAGTVNPYPGFGGEARVGIVRNGALDDFTTGAGPGGGPHFKIFNQTSISDLQTYVPSQRYERFVFDATFLGGVAVS